MNAVEAAKVSKSFNGKLVIRKLSFELEEGEIFGLLGPNGAGKTTAIRILLDILKPDCGEVILLGTPLPGKVRDKVGYLPEERGLYKKVSVMDCLTYFGRLKGLSKGEANSRAESLLERVGMLDCRDKNIDQLSKGMQQKVQFIATLVHSPKLVILDEPFSGLDPVNTRLVKDLILELRDEGKAVILSTHMMEQGERMCDRILMLNEGEAVLYGHLKEIKEMYGRNTVVVEFDGKLKGVDGISRADYYGNYAELVLEEGAKPQEILRQLVEEGTKLKRFEVSAPSLNEIFVEIVEGEG